MQVGRLSLLVRPRRDSTIVRDGRLVMCPQRLVRAAAV